MKHIIATIAAIVLLAGCATTPHEPAPLPMQPAPQPPAQLPENALRVGTTPTGPPLTFTVNGQFQGLDCDLARGLGAYLERPVVFFPLDWEDLIPALEQGRIDIIMSGMTVTSDRLRFVDFCEPYMQVGQMAMVQRENLKDYLQASQVVLTKGKVGVEKDTTGDFLVRGQFQFANRVPFTSAPKAAQALKAGKVDMIVHDAPTLWWLAAANPGNDLMVLPYTFTNEFLAYAVQKGNEDLRGNVNAYLNELRANGQLKELTSRWVVVTSPAMGK